MTPTNCPAPALRAALVVRADGPRLRLPATREAAWLHLKALRAESRVQLRCLPDGDAA
jgi:hypothetical protein